MDCRLWVFRVKGSLFIYIYFKHKIYCFITGSILYIFLFKIISLSLNCMTLNVTFRHKGFFLSLVGRTWDSQELRITQCSFLICAYYTYPGGEEIHSAAWLSMTHKLQASILKCHFYWSPFDVPFDFPGVDKLCLWHFPNSRPWKSEFKWALKKT